MRSLLFIAVAVLCGVSGPAAAKTVRTVERIAAVVNDNIILQSDLHRRIRPLLSQLQQIPDKQMRRQRLVELRQQALDHMVDEKLIAQQASKLKVGITDRELERAVADVMRKNKLTREQLEEALRREGKSIRSYKVQILRPQLLRLKVLNAAVRSRVAVGEDEIKTAYQKNMRDLGVETKVRARHIFIAIREGASAGEVKQRRKHAEALLAQLRAGKTDFAALAKKHSEDSVTRSDGGDLGTFGRGTLPPSVERVVFAAKKGEISGPLRTSRGFHLVQVTGRQESSARPYKEVRRQLKQQIYQDKMEKATKAWLREVRKRSHVVIKI